MLYDPRTKTLIQTHAEPTIAASRLEQLAKLKGSTTKNGEVIEQVAVVFFRMADAERALPDMKRFGLECRGFGDDGIEKVLSTGTRMTTMRDAPNGPLVPLLREESWPHLATAVHRRLLGGNFRHGPWVTFGYDLPTTVARIGPNDLHGRTIADLEAEALRELATRKPKRTNIDGHTIGISDEYGAEMILLPELMKGIAAELGTGLLAVGVPEEHGFLATSAEKPAEADHMIRWTRQTFDRTQKRRVSPIPFIVDARGAIVGIVSATPEPPPGEAEPELPQKPWWKFW